MMYPATPIHENITSMALVGNMSERNMAIWKNKVFFMYLRFSSREYISLSCLGAPSPFGDLTAANDITPNHI